MKVSKTKHVTKKGVVKKNPMSDIDKVEAAIERRIAEEGANRWGYPENQKRALRKFIKQARQKELSGNKLYAYWKEFDTFGVSITGRSTGNRAFEDVFGRETVRKWYKPIYESHVLGFNKALGEAIRRS